MKIKSTAFYIILFFLLCIASIFILHHPEKKAPATHEKIVDNFINKAKFTEFNQEGGLKSEITADTVTNYQNSGATYFVKPRILVYSDQKIPWRIHSDEATMEKVNNVTTLSGHVVIHQLQTIGHPETFIYTSTLTVYPKKSYAETEAPVQIRRRDMVISGIGLTANLKTGQYQLHTETKAILQPGLLQSKH